MQKIGIVVLLLILTGCASFNLESPNGWKVEYTRFWDQELVGVSFKMDANGTVEGGLEKQVSESEKTLALLLGILQKSN